MMAARFRCDDWLRRHRDEIEGWWGKNAEGLVEARQRYEWPPRTSSQRACAIRANLANRVAQDVESAGMVTRSTFAAVLEWGFNNDSSVLEQIEDDELAEA